MRAVSSTRPDRAHHTQRWQVAGELEYDKAGKTKHAGVRCLQEADFDAIRALYRRPAGRCPRFAASRGAHRQLAGAGL